MTPKEIITELKNIQTKTQEAWGILHLDQKNQEIKRLEKVMSAPNFWSDTVQAGEITQKYDELKKESAQWLSFRQQTTDLLEMAQLDEQDRAVNLREELESSTLKLKDQFAEAEIGLLFSGPHDCNNAFLSIHAGTGGVDAMDFAEMLLRMYLRFAEKKGFKVQVLNESRGGEAGVKSITLLVKGTQAYGFLKSEHGVHRLVRISPFDAEKMRHTSFALVEVLPEIDELATAGKQLEIRPEDLRVDTFMSSGKGGQSVNTTYSAVRLVHLPTGLTVSCQNERSQQQNKEMAMKILKAKLVARLEEEQAQELADLRGEYHEAGWSNQIRSYVLHPYHLVKDHRTEFESKDPEKVLDGDLIDFIEAYLKFQRH